MRNPALELFSSERAYEFLSRILPFSFLPEEGLEKAVSNLSMAHCPKDMVLFIQGQTKIEHLYIIWKGAAERYFEEKDQKTLAGTLSEGDLYGGISILVNNGLAVRTLRMIEDTYFYILPKKNFLELCEHYQPFSEFFTDTFGKRMVDKSYASIVSKMMQPKDEIIHFFDQPISSILSKKELLTCYENTSIRDAAIYMSKHQCSSIFVKGVNEKYKGIVTDNDLRRKVVAKGYDINQPVHQIMSAPLRTISSQSLIFESLMTMINERIKHLAVTDTDEKVVGIISNRDMLAAQGQSPLYLIQEVMRAESLEEVIDSRKRLPETIQSLINRGAKAKNVTRYITTISDTILNKIIQFAINEVGPPPVKFVFMILGSEGRKEQTLKTDQDNAIIFEDVPKSEEEQIQKYFLLFGEKVCGWLDQAGYDFCQGKIMAKNPKWCQPLSVWKEYFSSWIHAAEPEDLLQSSIFFDFRGAYGDMEMINDLRRFLFASLVGWVGFFRHLTENALHFKPPIGFFRNFVVESKGEHINALDIKGALQPIVDFARIYALHNQIEETNTLERLNRLYIKKVLTWQEYNELEQAYSFMMQLRFVRQVRYMVDKNEKPNNYLNPKKLSKIEQTMLKEIFKRIEKFQAKLSFEFIGIF